MKEFYHLYSLGENVLFRGDEDYIFFNNKLAVSAYLNGVCVLAYAIMSSHFHIILKVSDVGIAERFVAVVKKQYAMHYHHRYRKANAMDIKVSIDPVDYSAIVDKVTYVLKNPVHHYLKILPFEYRYSSIGAMFVRHILIPDAKSCYENSLKRVADLRSSQLKTLAAGQKHYGTTMCGSLCLICSKIRGMQ
ncbi:MAG: hypothetical protein HUJ89_07635 [Bacteroidales bacterium]|nr:hypothetical protein [Bacteroidales bacterium]